MTQAFIYSEILAELGWFDPRQEFKRLSDDVNYVHYINTPISINEDTIIAYFPGCFAEFHQGHVSVIDEMKVVLEEITQNYLIVIAPANTDYTVSKYGAESIHATNKYRYDRIVDVLNGYEGNVAIDLNPMLNNDRDYNFTDLLKDFVERHVGCFDSLKNPPYIVCGKDRKYFHNLEKLTKKIRVFYAPDTTQLSSSNLIKSEPKKIQKKKVFLRCHNHEEYELFVDFFSKHYADVVPVFFEREIERAKEISEREAAEVTICKDYASFLPYVPFHRSFLHPLMSANTHVGDVDALKGKVVLDSDVFTGSTRDAVERTGGKLVAVMDFSNKQDILEIVDFPDFYDDNYRYPYYDISTRCSMLPFTEKDHVEYEMFMRCVQRLKQRRK